MEKVFSIKFFFKYWYALPLVWTFILNILAGISGGIVWFFYPFPFFYLIFFMIYIKMSRKKLVFYNDDLQIVNGFKSFKVHY